MIFCALKKNQGELQKLQLGCDTASVSDTAHTEILFANVLRKSLHIGQPPLQYLKLKSDSAEPFPASPEGQTPNMLNNQTPAMAVQVESPFKTSAACLLLLTSTTDVSRPIICVFSPGS